VEYSRIACRYELPGSTAELSTKKRRTMIRIRQLGAADSTTISTTFEYPRIWPWVTLKIRYIIRSVADNCETNVRMKYAVPRAIKVFSNLITGYI
jgi:hypothetical protein